jgi:DNA invertase Pin-like site-specific DNA recombinase
MKAALYGRVSTSDKGQDPELQLREMRDFCPRRDWNIADSYVDIGVSGSKDSRPELDRLMRDAHARKFDVVIVWKFDRFARSTSHLLRALETFNVLGIAFVSLRESIDTTTPAGKLMFTMIAAMAEFERDLIKERVRAGIAHRKAKGLRIGRKPVQIDQHKLLSLRAAGKTIRQIADTLGCSRSVVFLTLQKLAA